MLLFENGHVGDALRIQEILRLYMKASSMPINAHKSSLVLHMIPEDRSRHLKSILQYTKVFFQEGIKYLGFYLKANDLILMIGSS